MSSVFAIGFVIAATLIVKWLLFDDDLPVSESDDSPYLRIVPRQPESESDPQQGSLSKSA